MSNCNRGPGFKRTVQAGTFGEQFLRRLLTAAGIRNWKNPASQRSKMLEWDVGFELDGVERTFEVKFDQMAAKTGNIAVEYWNVRQGKPSGINATTADLWAVILQDPLTTWVCRTADLRLWFDTKPCYRDIACGGDDNAAMKLYRKDELLPVIFQRVDDLHPSELAPALRKLLHVREVPAAAA